MDTHGVTVIWLIPGALACQYSVKMSTGISALSLVWAQPHKYRFSCDLPACSELRRRESFEKQRKLINTIFKILTQFSAAASHHYMVFLFQEEGH